MVVDPGPPYYKQNDFDLQVDRPLDGLGLEMDQSSLSL